MMMLLGLNSVNISALPTRAMLGLFIVDRKGHWEAIAKVRCLSLWLYCYCFISRPPSTWACGRPSGGPCRPASVYLRPSASFLAIHLTIVRTGFGLLTVSHEFLHLLIVHTNRPHLLLLTTSSASSKLCVSWGRYTFFTKFRISASGQMEVRPEDVLLSS